MASLPMVIVGDVDDLTLATSPGTTITGHVIFEQGPPSPLPQQMRVMAIVGRPDEAIGAPSPPPARVTPDLTFTIKGLMGDLLLRLGVPNHYVKSITANGQDITDTPHEFKQNERVVVTVTSRGSTLEGSVTGARGSVTVDTDVRLFSEDRASGRMNSTRTRRTGTDAEGHFRVAGLMAGRYLVAAVPRSRLSFGPGSPDAAFFEQLSKEATPLVLGDDDQRKVDLKLLDDSGVQ